MVRSTSQRWVRRRTLWPSQRLTISISNAGMTLERHQEERPGIGAVCEQLAQERELSEQGGQQQHTAVAVLNVGGVTRACSSRPSLSTRTWRFLPLISLPASKPCGSIWTPLFRRSSRSGCP